MHAYQHTARARDTRARCPPDKLTPRSPITCQKQCTLNSETNAFALHTCRKPETYTEVLNTSQRLRINHDTYTRTRALAPEEQLGSHNRPFAIVEIVKIRFQSTHAYNLRAGQ